MSPRRLRLEGEVLDDLLTLARTRYGSDAKVVSVEKVTVGGLFGFLASRHFEVVVELPDPPRHMVATAATPVIPAPPATPQGLAALIESAEIAESGVEQVLPEWRPSTTSADFDELMDSLSFQTGVRPLPRLLGRGSFAPGEGEPTR